MTDIDYVKLNCKYDGVLYIALPSSCLVRILTLTLRFHFSLAGPDVRLLDPPEHVPDPEVPGDYRWRYFPRREPHAGAESSEEVRLLMEPGTDSSLEGP